MPISDWSSDVCSSDLRRGRDAGLRPLGHGGRGHQQRERERRAVYMSKHGKAVLIVRVIIVRGTVSIAKVRARGFGAQWRSVSIPSAASKSWSNGRRRAADRKSVVEGKSVSVRVDLGGRSIIKKKTKRKNREPAN